MVGHLLKTQLRVLVIVVILIASTFAYFYFGNDFVDKYDEDDVLEYHDGDYLGYVILIHHDGNSSNGVITLKMKNGTFNPIISIEDGNYSDFYLILMEDFVNWYEKTDAPGFKFTQKNKLETPFGIKGVNTFFRSELTYEEEDRGYVPWFVHVMDVGIESKVIFKITLSNPDLIITAKLKSTNVTEMWNVDDDSYYTDVSDHIPHIDEGANVREPAFEGELISGAVSLDDVTISYNATGATISLYFISFDQLKSSEFGFSCNETLSSDVITSKKVAGVSGQYLYFIYVQDSEADGYLMANFL